MKLLLTGGIGGGKSSVLEYLQNKGFITLQADDVAKKLLLEMQQVQQIAQSLFGEDVFIDGVLQVDLFRARFFLNHVAREQYSAFLHPLVEKVLREKTQPPAHYAIEIPLLAEVKKRVPDSYNWAGPIITIESPEPMRIQRVKTRNQWSDDIIQAILQAQAGAEERKQCADYVICNTQSLEYLFEQVEKIIAELG